MFISTALSRAAPLPFPIASQDAVGDALAVDELSDTELEAILNGTAASLLGLSQP